MNYELYELYNTETAQIEAVEKLSPAQATGRNLQLCRNGEPHRWVRSNPAH